MQKILGLLGTVISIYSILIFVRIIISWFSNIDYSKPIQVLRKITDPYLDWWRKALNIRLGIFDLSPLFAIAFLSVLQSVLFTIARFDKITLGSILAIILISLWQIITFILGFCVIVLVLRIIAYLTNRDIYGTFWRTIDSISQPLLYKTNRIIFGNRIPNYMKGIVISTLSILGLWIGGGFLIPLLARLLAKLPL
jgi:YggT family protein